MPEQIFSILPESPWLAPLAGWSDLSFRLLCKDEGAKVTCTEMISAKGLFYGGKNTEDLLTTCETDNPVVAQIFGAEHDFMEKGIAILQKRGFQNFDVNVGCSVHKVIKTGAGAAMLRDIPNLLKVAKHVINQVHNPIFIEKNNKEAGQEISHSNLGGFTSQTHHQRASCPLETPHFGVCKQSLQKTSDEGAWRESFPSKKINLNDVGQKISQEKKGKIGFKIRLGFEMGNDISLSLAKELEALGADWITLHPRYAKQSFSGVPQYQALIQLKNALKIPVIASGDLFTAEDGVRVLLETGVDAVMYARGAMANPFIFKEHTTLWNHVQKEGLSVHEIPTIAELLPKSDSEIRHNLGELITRHLQYAQEFNPHRALLQMRTIVPRYVKNLENAKALRLALIACRSYEELHTILNDFFK